LRHHNLKRRISVKNSNNTKVFRKRNRISYVGLLVLPLVILCYWEISKFHHYFGYAVTRTTALAPLQNPFVINDIITADSSTSINRASPASTSTGLNIRTENKDSTYPVTKYFAATDSASDKATSEQPELRKMRKKFVAIHIGPIKTATTTIQMDSSQNKNFTRALANDGVLYIGKFSKRESRFEKGMECSRGVITGGEVPENHSTGTISISGLTFKQKQDVIKKECWGSHQELIQRSLIFSSEFYSVAKYDFVGDLFPLYQQVFIDYLGYDEIIIIGAYRRYGEWLSSAYKQRAKQTCLHQAKRSCLNVWEYMNKFIESSQYGTSFCYNLDRSLLPFIRDEQKFAKTVTATAASIETSSATNTTFQDVNHKGSKIKFDILNYFQLPREKHYNSITTELYCKSLGTGRTENACRYSRDERSNEEINTIKNKGSNDIVKYHDIVVEAKNRGWIKKPTYFTDEGVEETTHNRRIKEVVTLEEYHTKELGLAGATNLPLLCPSQSQLQIFLDKSLRFEELIMPSFSLTALGKEEHIRSFWELANKKEFCWLDIERLFQNASSWEDLLHKRLVIDKW